MSPNRTLVLLLVLTALVGWGVAWRQHVALRDAVASQDAILAERKKGWDKALDEANNRSHRLEAQLADLQKPTASDGEAPRDGSSSRAPTNRPNNAIRPGTSLFADLKKNPAFAKMWTSQQKAQLDGRYGSLFRNLNLKTDELEKLKDLLVEKQNGASEVMVAARAKGINPQDNKDAYGALLTEYNQDLENRLSNQLGSEKYAQYQQYERTLPQRNFVNQFDRRLSYSSSPLQATQREQLVQLLAQSSATKSDAAAALAGTIATTNSGRVGAKISDETIAEAQTILLPDQLAALVQLRSEQQLQQQMAEMTRAAARTANTNSPAANGGISSTDGGNPTVSSPPSK